MLFFLDKGFKFQSYVCIGYHHVLMMSIKLSNIAISNTSSADYHCIINRISKSEAEKRKKKQKKVEHCKL